MKKWNQDAYFYMKVTGKGLLILVINQLKAQIPIL